MSGWARQHAQECITGSIMLRRFKRPAKIGRSKG